MNDDKFYQEFWYYAERDIFVVYVHYETFSDLDGDVICGNGTLCIVDNEASAKAICDNLNRSALRVIGR
jgi:hypothetical protein